VFGVWYEVLGVAFSLPTPNTKHPTPQSPTSRRLRVNKEVSPIVAIIAAIAVVALVGFFIYRSSAGSVQGDGKAGNVQAAPPLPDHLKKKMQDSYRAKQQSQGQAVPR
jgi:hypothetical protein